MVLLKSEYSSAYSGADHLNIRTACHCACVDAVVAIVASTTVTVVIGPRAAVGLVLPLISLLIPLLYCKYCYSHNTHTYEVAVHVTTNNSVGG